MNAAPGFDAAHCVARWTIDAAEPALDGHFPGQPVLPGALLLDWALHATAPTTLSGGAGTVRVRTAKFAAPVQPGCTLALCVRPQAAPGAPPGTAQQATDFSIWRLGGDGDGDGNGDGDGDGDGAALVASGSLSWPAPEERPAP